MAALRGSEVQQVVVACDAGMGSSVLLTGQLKKRFKDIGIGVEHSPVDRIPAGTKVVLCQQGLAERARIAAPDAVVIPFQLFMGDPAFDRLDRQLRNDEEVG
jgi:galactose PTS system EIIB component